MKILVINGSSRGERSNTLRLTRAFTHGLCAAAPGSPFPWMTLCPRASRLPRKHWPCKRKNACAYGKCWRS